MIYWGGKEYTQKNNTRFKRINERKHIQSTGQNNLAKLKHIQEDFKQVWQGENGLAFNENQKNKHKQVLELWSDVEHISNELKKTLEHIKGTRERVNSCTVLI